MPRLFIGLDLPPEVDQHLELVCGGVPGARWEGADKFHVTLGFLGELEGTALRHVARSLEQVTSPGFELTLAGVGFFPPRGLPRSLWVGMADTTDVIALHQRIWRVLVSAGVPAESRKFAPHVTLARLRDAPRQRVAAFLAHHSLFRSAPFWVGSFALYSSIRTSVGSHYRIEQRYPLGRRPSG